MKVPPHLLLLLSLASVINLIHVQSQQGFLTLLCGMMPENNTYTIPSSNLTVSSDAAFIDSGESRTNAQATFLRRFPRGKRNCYNLNVTKGSKYLVRATFVYGNYDNRNEKPIFDLHLGPNKWTTVDIEGERSAVVTREIIHVPRWNHLQVCLVKTGNTTPFISTLQLRPLSDDIYNVASRPNASLALINRLHFGNIYIRFPYDIYDRAWVPLVPLSSWNLLNTTLNVDTSDIYRPPKPVMQIAATPENSSVPFGLYLPLHDPGIELQVYMYFAEIEELKPNETREFDIQLNGVHYYGPLRPEKLRAETINATLTERSCKGRDCQLTLVKTARSTHPPILNAVEVYSIPEFRQTETYQNDVETMKRLKAVYGTDRTSWEGDPCVPTELMWDGLKCTSHDPPTVTSLNLSSSGLTGTISPWIQNLTRLEQLDLSNNTLTGGVPEFLASMGSLSVIYLRHNMLSGSVPQTLLDRARNGSVTLYIQGNPNVYCPLDACKDQDLRNKAKARRITISVVASVASVVAALAALAIFFVYRKRSASRGAQSTPRTFQLQQRFTCSEVLKMTNDLESSVGRGRFGVLYHGCMNKTERVVVEILEDPTAQDRERFNKEVELLLRVHHNNLVHLVGYSDEGDILALVYEYMANGDLKNRLSGEHEGETLSWTSRLRIAIQAAQGLLYLHRGCNPPMVHGDIKTSNILLDGNFQAKVANFGLPRSSGTESKTHTSSDVVGTPGYIDPEYQKTSWLTDKSDVYSFGVVLLEILTNQAVIDEAREGEHIREWVQGMLATKVDITEIIDPRLQGEYKSSSVWKALELAMACVSPSCNNRPSMLHAVAELKECLAIETSTGPERQALGLNSGSVTTSLTMPR